VSIAVFCVKVDGAFALAEEDGSHAQRLAYDKTRRPSAKPCC